MSFKDGGEPDQKLVVTGETQRIQLEQQSVLARHKIFKEGIDFRANTLLERFQMMAFLNKGLEITFIDNRSNGNNKKTSYKYDGGIKDFVQHVNTSKEALFEKVGFFQDQDDEQEVEIAFQWNTGFNSDGIHSFANGISTTEGGMHEQGFRTALTRVVNKYARDNGQLNKSDDGLQGEDIREGLTAIISVRSENRNLKDKQKQTRNVSIKSLVEKATVNIYVTGLKKT